MNGNAANGLPLPTPLSTDDPWLSATPSLRAELKIDLRKQKGRLVAIIEDPVRSRFYQVGNVEYHFLMMLDGQRPVSEIVQLMQHDRGYEQFDADSAKKICTWLASMNLLNHSGAKDTERICQAAKAREKQRLIGLLNPVSFRFRLLNPNRTLRLISPFTRWLFTPMMLIVWVITGLVAWILVDSDYERFCNSAVGILAADRWIWLLVIWVVLKIIHEAAHGVACQKYGGDVPQAGLLILLLAPLAFVDVTSSWRFSSRRKRMVVSAAGMYIELFLAFIAIIIWFYSSSGWLSDISYNIVIMAGISTVLFNANPLMRFDGYYLLSDSLGIVNLYGKGQNWFGDRLRHFIFGFPLDQNICAKSELKLVATYGICSFVWRILLSVSLLLVASTLLGGAGLALAVIGGVFWIWLPLVQNLRKIQTAAQSHPVNRKRMGIVATGFTGLILCFFVGLKAPGVTQAPAIVQFKDEKVLRAASDGFIREIHVVDAQAVAEGTVLLRIENPELIHELNELKQSSIAANIQARIHRQRGEISLQQSLQIKVNSLQQQIEEMEEKVAQLNVTAPFDGVIYKRGLANLTGSFVKQGDAILRFADPRQKIILTSIDQQQIKSVKSAQYRPVRFLFSGVNVLSAKLDSIEPRASDLPIDPSLTAAAGGSLPVRPSGNEQTGQDTDSEFRLINPRFTGKSALESGLSSRLQAGQRGTAFLHGREVSLGGFFVLKSKAWIRAKLRTATQSGF